MTHCPNCGSMLGFAGLDRAGRRVTTCMANLTTVEGDSKRTTTVPCSLGLYYVEGKVNKNPMWYQRRSEDDDPKPIWGLVRCNVHGQEWARFRTATVRRKRDGSATLGAE